jgi:hypothetical protein
MLVPAILYGKYDEAAAAVRKAVTAMVRGASWVKAFGPLTVDAAAPGLLLLSGPNPLLAKQPHFQFFLPHLAVSNAVDKGRLPAIAQDQIFLASLQQEWSLLGLMSQPNVMWVYPQSRHQPFLQAAKRFWNSLDAEGPRYSVGLVTGESLWSLPSNLKYVLANYGVDPMLLRMPLPQSGIAGLIEGRKTS